MDLFSISVSSWHWMYGKVIIPWFIYSQRRVPHITGKHGSMLFLFLEDRAHASQPPPASPISQVLISAQMPLWWAHAMPCHDGKRHWHFHHLKEGDYWMTSPLPLIRCIYSSLGCHAHTLIRCHHWEICLFSKEDFKKLPRGSSSVVKNVRKNT